MIQKYENMKIGILGLGEENIALVRYLVKYGAKNITICDQRGSEEFSNIDDIQNAVSSWRLGPDYLDNLEDFDVVFRTPGLPYLNEKIQKAKIDGVEVSSEIKLFFDLCPSPIIGVTGTKGKGTTATLISEILKKAGKRVFLAGNIGNAPIEFLDHLTADDIVVLELSSFQLQDLEKSPHIGVVLNISSDHLDVHANNDEYIEAKTNIIRHQTKDDFAVINIDYLTSFEFAALTSAQVYYFSRKKSVDQGAWVNSGEILYRENNEDIELAQTSDLLLRGEHNFENICASCTAARLAGADFESISEVIKSFKGLEHRLELVTEIDGVKFYNDSFSTNPDTAIAAIKSFTEPIILIAGGSEKNADYAELGKVISDSNVKTAILIGVTGSRIKSEIQTSNVKVIDTCQNLDDVIDIIKQEMKLGDVVLLSPASASFDWFANYKDRGQQFKENVSRIK